MSLKLFSNKLSGDVYVPSSKSILHRAIICASFAEEKSKIFFNGLSDDVIATIEAMKNFGAKINLEENFIEIEGINRQKIKKQLNINCNESGSTLRFLIPLSIIIENEINFNGRGRLFDRPLFPYIEVFKKNNVFYKFSQNNLFLKGHINSGVYNINGDTSSQFISGMLMALPLLDGESVINVIGDLESKNYIDLTLDIIKKFGIVVENINYKKFLIKGNQKYSACEIEVEGDFSQAAFFIVANSIGNDINIKNINYDTSLQGDKKAIDLINFIDNSTENHLSIDAKDIPDIIPILSIKAALSNKIINFYNVKRLRLKESDRLNGIEQILKNLGVNVKTDDNNLYVEGLNIENNFKIFNSAKLSSLNDHRLAMTIAIASTALKNNETFYIDNESCVSKSFPTFWKTFAFLGGRYEHLG